MAPDAARSRGCRCGYGGVGVSRGGERANFVCVMAVGREPGGWGAPTGYGGRPSRRQPARAVRARHGARGDARGDGAWRERGSGCNGGRARCPHRAARVMSMRHDGVRAHGRRAGREQGRGMPSRAPRRGAAARAGRPGGQTSRPTAMPHERGTRGVRAASECGQGRTSVGRGNAAGCARRREPVGAAIRIRLTCESRFFI